MRCDCVGDGRSRSPMKCQHVLICRRRHKDLAAHGRPSPIYIRTRLKQFVFCYYSSTAIGDPRRRMRTRLNTFIMAGTFVWFYRITVVILVYVHFFNNESKNRELQTITYTSMTIVTNSAFCQHSEMLYIHELWMNFMSQGVKISSLTKNLDNPSQD